MVRLRGAPGTLECKYTVVILTYEGCGQKSGDYRE